MGVAWRPDGDDLVLVSTFPLLGGRGPRVSAAGIEAGILRRRLWAWDQIAAVTWDLRGDAQLAVCIYGDPYVHGLPLPAWASDRRWDVWRERLEEIRPVVERYGSRIENRVEAATHWWHLHPDARRDR